MMLAHPAELSLDDIATMSRRDLIEQLLVFNNYCSFRFSRAELYLLSLRDLRGLLYAARRHYHSKGY